jgi:hypothetical protein
MRTRLEGDLHQTAHCGFSIPCKGGRCHGGKTGRPLGARLSEHKHNLKEGLLEKSKLAKRGYGEGYRVASDESRILKLKVTVDIGNTKNRPFMANLTNLNSQPSLGVSLIWILLISNLSYS